MDPEVQISLLEQQLTRFELLFVLMKRTEENKEDYDDLKRRLILAREMVTERQNGTLTREKFDSYRKQFDAK